MFINNYWLGSSVCTIWSFTIIVKGYARTNDNYIMDPCTYVSAL